MKRYGSNFERKNLNDLELFSDCYTVGEYAASGVFYEVRKCVFKEDETKRNVKVLRKSQMTKNELALFPSKI